MQIGLYRFSPTWGLSSFIAVMVMLFIALSLWQWGRAEYKQDQAEQIMQQNQRSRLPLSLEPVPWPESRYRAAVVTGEFEQQGQILLDNSVLRGKAGYYVITPFRIAGTETHLLVNRGWVTVGRDRAVLPAAPPPKGELQLEGTLEKPRAKTFSFGELKADAEGNARWIYLDTQYYTETLAIPVFPYILQQTSDVSDGLIRHWPPFQNKAGMHIGYAIQWAAFALIALIAWLSMSLKKSKTIKEMEYE